MATKTRISRRRRTTTTTIRKSQLAREKEAGRYLGAAILVPLVCLAEQGRQRRKVRATTRWKQQQQQQQGRTTSSTPTTCTQLDAGRPASQPASQQPGPPTNRARNLSQRKQRALPLGRHLSPGANLATEALQPDLRSLVRRVGKRPGARFGTCRSAREWESERARE